MTYIAGTCSIWQQKRKILFEIKCIITLEKTILTKQVSVVRISIRIIDMTILEPDLQI